MGLTQRSVPRGLGLLGVLLLLTASCDWFDDPSPEVIRVVIEGEAVALSLTTATEFFAATNEAGGRGYEVLNADTSTITLPLDRSWDIGSVGRFLMVVAPMEMDTVAMRLRVLVDDGVIYDQRHTAVAQNPVRFAYLFNQQVLVDFELL